MSPNAITGLPRLALKYIVTLIIRSFLNAEREILEAKEGGVMGTKAREYRLSRIV